MDSLFELGHKLWIDAQLRAPTWAQDWLIPSLYDAKDLVAELQPYLIRHHLRGHNQAGPLTVDYVGLHHLPTFTNALFAEEPTVTRVKRAPLWQIASLTDSSDADLVVVVSTKRLIGTLSRCNAVVLPFLVTMTLNVRGSWEDVRARLHKSVRKNELRLIRKYNYEYEISTRDEDFELFYYRMYVPTVEMRKGELASPMSIREAYQYFRYGSLLQMIKRNGQYVAGGLSYVQGGLVKFRLMGMLNADEKLFHEGALAACYYAIVDWANQRGHQGVVFGECVPRLKNGVFQYKRKWGGMVTYSDKVHKQIWVKIQRDTPAIRHFFKENPLIISDEQGQLQGLIVTDDPDNVSLEVSEEWHEQFATPGLSSLVIRSMADLFHKGTGAAETEPIIPPVVQLTE
jgi:hypothetical protein